MVNYSENIIDCRHCQISNYFGEKIKLKCIKNCNNCINNNNNKIYELDITNSAKTIFNIIMLLNNSATKTNLKIQFKKSVNYHNLIEKFKTQKKVLEVFQRIVIYLVINKYLKEILELNEFGCWMEKYKLFKKCKKILSNQEKVYISMDR